MLSWGFSACSKRGAGSCDSARPEYSGGMCFLGGIVGVPLCWVVCWYGESLVCMWVSIWVMLPVGETRFHPRVWMFCAHCFFCGIGGIERDRERLWSYVRSIVL